MGWAERLNPMSRRNRRRDDGTMTPFNSNVVQMSKGRLAMIRAFNKVLAKFRRAA